MGPEQLRGRRDWKGLINILDEYDSFVFSTHVDPDADGLGSELALARFLKQNGKSVHILNPTPIRVNLEFMPEANEVEVYDSDKHLDLLKQTDVCIAFDIGNYKRLNELARDLPNTDVLTVSIDHHPGDKSQFKQSFDFPTASSTGVLIFDLLKQMDDSSLDDIKIAHPIYAAMMSDTGNFRFNNTDPETLQAAARLVAAGVKPYELYVHIYEDLNTPGRLKVIQKLLSELKYDCDGRLAWSMLDYEEMRQFGAIPEDFHSLSDFIRSIKGVEVGASLVKMSDGKVDVSMRSKGKIPINGVAQKFDGGGHAFAAGCSISSSLSAAADALIDECRSVIKDWDSHA